MKATSFSLAALLAALLLMAACVQSPTQEPAPAAGADRGTEQAAPAEISGRCGDPSRLSERVYFYNWTDYIDPEILTRFEEECGVEVVYDTYASNEDLLAKLQAGASGYDLIVPSDYMVTTMRELDMLRELDHANIPNLANLYPRFTEAPYDPGNVYSVPYQWGTTGIGYNLDEVGSEPDSWAYLFDPERAAQYAGRMSLLNDPRELIGAALKYLGYSANSTDPDELEQAKAVLLAVKPYVATFDSESFEDLLASGDVVIGHGWSGDYFRVIYENPDMNLGYIIPQEGGIIWTDNLAIPRTAPNPYTAEVLINYLLDPEMGGMLTNFTYYASPNQAAEPYILDEIKEDPGIYPAAETLDRMEFLRDLGAETLLWDRIWTEVKAQ